MPHYSVYRAKNYITLIITLVLTSPLSLTSLRFWNGHAPLIIQKERACSRQEVQPRLVGPYAKPNSSIALGMVGGECEVGKVSVALTHSHSGAALASNFSLIFFPSSCLPPFHFSTYFEVVQRARTSYECAG
jgi:hypothetical protein